MLLKNEFKTGDKVYLRNGEIGVIICSAEHHADSVFLEDRNIHIKDYNVVYNDIIKHKQDSNLDIVDVEEICSLTNFFNLIDFDYLKNNKYKHG